MLNPTSTDKASPIPLEIKAVEVSYVGKRFLMELEFSDGSSTFYTIATEKFMRASDLANQVINENLMHVLSDVLC